MPCMSLPLPLPLSAASAVFATATLCRCLCLCLRLAFLHEAAAAFGVGHFPNHLTDPQPLALPPRTLFLLLIRIYSSTSFSSN